MMDNNELSRRNEQAEQKTDELTEQEQDELELEVGDRIRAETEEEGGWEQDTSTDEERSEDEGGSAVAQPEPIPSPTPAVPEAVRVPVPVAPVLGETGDAPQGAASGLKQRPHSDLDDLFEVPEEDDNDIFVDDLFELDDEDLDFESESDLSDLTQVTQEDIMGRPPKPRPPKFRRTGRPYNPPPSMGGVG